MLFRTKNNPVLIGERCVGKAAIVEGLAQRIVKRDVLAGLVARLYSFDMGAIMAGAAKYKGEHEDPIKSALNEVEKVSEEGDPCIILFIDALHIIASCGAEGGGAEGGGMDAGNLFKPPPGVWKVQVYWWYYPRGVPQVH